jgi:glycerophosphoryl diester phosphodiesterase
MRNLWILAAALGAAGFVQGEPARPAKDPIVIAHRGASGYLPEHTLAAYELAVAQGADFIEPDLVSTKDHVLIARHEQNLTDTTDVGSRPEYASRKTTRAVDGASQTGWFAEDFTLAEIKTLRARQRMPTRSKQFDGAFEIPTFEEVVALAKRLSTQYRRPIGVYPETKHPSYHVKRGLALEGALLDVLKKAGWDQRDSPVFIQSFESTNLRELRKLTLVRLVQLVGDGGSAQVTAAALREIATYADGVGPAKRLVVNADGHAGDVVKQAHAAGLFVHVWTMRNEGSLLLAAYGGDPIKEYLQFFCLGVDGLFSDFPDTAHTARELFRLSAVSCQPSAIS